MKISTRAFIAALTVVVVIVAVVAAWFWRAPSVIGVREPTRAEVNAAMREAHSQPTPEEKNQIQEWKKTHPGAFTKY